MGGPGLGGSLNELRAAVAFEVEACWGLARPRPLKA